MFAKKKRNEKEKSVLTPSRSAPNLPDMDHAIFDIDFVDDATIEAYRYGEAGQHDWRFARWCDGALAGNVRALAEVTRIIREFEQA
jgi:hypothetical protein